MVLSSLPRVVSCRSIKVVSYRSDIERPLPALRLVCESLSAILFSISISDNLLTSNNVGDGLCRMSEGCGLSMVYDERFHVLLMGWDV